MEFINKNWILDLVYPRHCPFCGEIQPYGASSICRKCIPRLKRVEKPYCMRCGKTVSSEDEEYCNDCHMIPKSYEKGYPVFVYQDPLKKALYDFKYHNQREYAVFFAKCMYLCYRKEWERLEIDGIVPVPVHRRKRRARGYNQAYLLAKELSKHLNVPCHASYLVRISDTNPQKELNDKERMNNLKNAFKIGQNRIELKRVLLVDDIYTSGATIDSCAKVLKSAAVEKVWYTSVAIGHGYSK
ncbi:MAG: ComF family protein [Lachnospiraceae bacterium]|nr:ComF family protein [Lachnospiraceae bacterium]